MSYSYKVITRASITLQLIEDVAIYQAELYSTAGNIFQSADRATDITVKVYKGLDDITERFTDIIWKRFSFISDDIIEDITWGDKFNGEKTITVTKADINNKALIQCEIYDVIGSERKLIAINNITIIDVNDLKPSKLPPDNPIDGQLWLDSSVDPPVIKMWDSYTNSWVVVAATSFARNLIRNSNYWTKNFNLYDKVSVLDLMKIEYLTDKRWGRIKSDNADFRLRGFSQNTSYPIKLSTDYVFHIKSAKFSNSELYNGNMIMCIYSIDENNKETILTEQLINLSTIPSNPHIKFKTLNNTNKIKVLISGEKGKMFDIIITELMLYDSTKILPWELAPEDINDSLDDKVSNNHEDIFNALTDNGKIQGIFTDKDEQGETNFYINASYIKTGTLVGDLIDAKGIIVKRPSDNYKTFEINKDGDIFLSSNNIFIGGVPAASVDDVSYKVEIHTSNGILFSNGIIETVLTAIVYKGKDNITNQISNTQITWTRTSADKMEDALWNETKGKHKKEITITTNDINKKATFDCSVDI